MLQKSCSRWKALSAAVRGKEHGEPAPLWCGTVRWQGDTRGNQRGPARLPAEWSIADGIVTSAQRGSWADTKRQSSVVPGEQMLGLLRAFCEHGQPACTAQNIKESLYTWDSKHPIHCIVVPCCALQNTPMASPAEANQTHGHVKNSKRNKFMPASQQLKNSKWKTCCSFSDAGLV